MTKQSESILTKFQKTHENTRVQVILFLAGGSLDKLLTLCEFTAGETENRVMKSEMPSAQDWFEMLCVNVSSKCYTVITVSCPYIYGNNVKLEKIQNRFVLFIIIKRYVYVNLWHQNEQVTSWGWMLGIFSL